MRDLEIEGAVLLNRAAELEKQAKGLKETLEASEARLRAARILRTELTRWTTQLQREARKPRDRSDESWPEAASNEAIEALRERAMDAEGKGDPIADSLALLLEVAARCRGPWTAQARLPARSPSDGGGPSGRCASDSGSCGPECIGMKDEDHADFARRRSLSRKASTKSPEGGGKGDSTGADVGTSHKGKRLSGPEGETSSLEESTSLTTPDEMGETEPRDGEELLSGEEPGHSIHGPDDFDESDDVLATDRGVERDGLEDESELIADPSDSTDGLGSDREL